MRYVYVVVRTNRCFYVKAEGGIFVLLENIVGNSYKYVKNVMNIIMYDPILLYLKYIFYQMIEFKLIY